MKKSYIVAFASFCLMGCSPYVNGVSVAKQPQTAVNNHIVSVISEQPNDTSGVTDKSLARCRDGSSEKIGKDACFGKGGIGESHLHYHSD